MTEHLKSTPRLQQDSHGGTTTSYVIGFILSLAYTIIPYLLVTNNVANGTRLLSIILAFAFVQMLIQVFFFLHLGRGPKPFYNVVFFGCTVFAMLVVTFGSVFIMNNLYTNMSANDVTLNLAESEGIYQVGGELTGACQAIKQNHQVRITTGALNPVFTEADKCDTISFINDAESDVVVAFGPHPEHQNYAGVSELIVKPGKSETLTLNQAGTFTYHTEESSVLSGSFSVRP